MSHHKAYMKCMRSIRDEMGVGLAEQIRGVVPENAKSGWKMKYDEAFM